MIFQYCDRYLIFGAQRDRSIMVKWMTCLREKILTCILYQIIIMSLEQLKRQLVPSKHAFCLLVRFSKTSRLLTLEKTICESCQIFQRSESSISRIHSLAIVVKSSSFFSVCEDEWPPAAQRIHLRQLLTDESRYIHFKTEIIYTRSPKLRPFYESYVNQ